MQTVAHLFRVTALTLVAVPTVAGNQPFSLSIGPVEQRVQRGSNVELKLTLTNVSGREITFVDTNRWCDYAIEVRDSRGQPPPQTKYARQLKCVHGLEGRRIVRALRPGESFEDVMFINQIYDLGRPDDYYVQIARKFPAESGQGTVKSNTTTVIIVSE